ncbi:flippase-like domain-containing protein, partial [Candidatus Bathyarchaeota archaeon]|nr:flippase-like domain-containing protein [Candidatus Bathyarchaeota archaeon]
IPFIALGLAIFVAYLLLFVNIEEMFATLGRTNLTIYLLGFGASIIELIFFALAWKYYLRTLSENISLKKSIIHSWIGNFVDLLIPAESVGGEICRIYFANREGVDGGKATAAALTQRIVGTVISIGTLIIGLFLIFERKIGLPPSLRGIIYLVISATAISLFIGMLLITKEKWIRKIVKKIVGFAEWATKGRLKKEEWEEKASRVVDAFYESLFVLRRNPRKFIPPLTFSLIQWFFGILVYYLVFASIGINVDFGILIVGHFIIGAVKSVPIGVPAEIGITEVAIAIVFGAFGVVSPAEAAAVAILIRIITVWFRMIVGFAILQLTGSEVVSEVSKKIFR